MAKQPVNIVERHLEKAVLGVCGAVFLACVVLFGVSTPNKIDIGSESVGPEAIDQHLLDAAHRLRDQLRRALVSEVEVENYVPLFSEASSPIEYAKLGYELPAPVPMLPRVPESVGSVPVAGEIKLAKVLAPEKPQVTFGRATLRLVPPVVLDPNSKDGRSKEGAVPTGVFDKAVNWVTVAAKFDQQQQSNVYRVAGYEVRRRNPYVVGIDLQRREKLSDGSYGQWVDVLPYAPLVLAKPPEVDIEQGRTGPIPKQDTLERVRGYFSLVRGTQADLLRPLFPETVHGEDWLYPKIDGYDIRAADLELCTADDKSGCQPRPYPRQWDIEPEQGSAEVSQRELIERKLGQAQAALNAWDWDEAQRIAEDEILNDKKDGVRKDQADRAKKIVVDAKQGRLDEKEKRIERSKDREEDDDPTLGRRSRYQLVWAHDAAGPLDGGAISGKTYQYRMRLRLYNRFCAVPSDLLDPEDAKKVTVQGEWSPPSEDVYIPPDTEFFLTSGNPSSRRGAKVTIFKWFEGVWVSGRFSIDVGRPMGGTDRKTVRIFKNGEEDKPLVDFATDMTVVDIDYDYMYRPKKRRGKAGFTVGPPTSTVALVYRDRAGDLHQRILEADRGSSGYKGFKEKVFDPKTAAR